MQSFNITPAEHLLHRLQKSKDFTSAYAITVEKTEGHTCLYLRLSAEYSHVLQLPGERQRSV